MILYSVNCILCINCQLGLTTFSLLRAQDNEYSDLFWASCGGGGGNFAVVTEFEFNPVQVCQYDTDSKSCTVLKLHLELPATAKIVMHYQKWSMKMSTRITVSSTGESILGFHLRVSH